MLRLFTLRKKLQINSKLAGTSTQVYYLFRVLVYTVLPLLYKLPESWDKCYYSWGAQTFVVKFLPPKLIVFLLKSSIGKTSIIFTYKSDTKSDFSWTSSVYIGPTECQAICPDTAPTDCGNALQEPNVCHALFSSLPPCPSSWILFIFNAVQDRK